MKILTYNIQSGLGIDGIRNIERAGILVKSLDVDIAGLQEVEMGSPRSFFQNQPRLLGEAAGMSYAYAHGFQRGPWRFGNCILSRFPIRSSTRHGLPSGSRPMPWMPEPRSLLAVQVDWTPSGVDGATRILHVLCTHLGLDRNERVGQVREIRRVLDALSGPVILMGDFNDFPDSQPIQELLNGSSLLDITTSAPTFPAPMPQSKIDYIFVRGLSPVSPSQVIDSPFSDHLPLLVEVSSQPDHPVI